MGGGVAIAALGSAMAYITKTLSGVAWWQIALTIVGVLLAVMVPAGIAGLVKLRRRDLSAMLEASGWAINARMRLTFKQGRFFTSRPRLPIGGMIARLWPLWTLLGLILAGAIIYGIWQWTRPVPPPPAAPQATSSTAPAKL